MNNFNFEARNFEGFIHRTGLYRVWVPVNDDGKGPLISIWIDPQMGSFESQRDEDPVTIAGVGDDVAEEVEDSERRSVTSLLCAAGNLCAEKSEASSKQGPWTEPGICETPRVRRRAGLNFSGIGLGGRRYLVRSPIEPMTSEIASGVAGANPATRWQSSMRSISA